MNVKLKGIILFLGLCAIAINHYLIPWESITAQKVESYFDDLIQGQKKDLADWPGWNTGDSRFHKRRECKGRVESWSDNHLWIQGRQNSDIYLSEQETGAYLVLNEWGDDSCKKISIYPITYKYSITNRFLKSRTSLALPRNLTAISSTVGKYEYQDLFYFDVANVPSKNIDAVAALIIAFLLLLFFWAGLFRSFYLSLVVGVAARLFTLILGVGPAFVRYPLFDSLQYTSSFWNPTLGDLFLNGILIFLASLAWSRRFKESGGLKSKWALLAYLSFGLLLSIAVFSTVWSILDNSQIVMDVGKSIEFGLLRLISYLSVLLIFGSQFLVAFRCAGLLSSTKKKNAYYIFLLAVSILLYPFSIAAGLVATLYSLLIIGTSQMRWAERLKEFRYQNLQFALVTSVAMAGVLSISVYKFHEKAELDAKRKFANHLLIKRDVLGEYYVNQLLEDAHLADLDQLTNVEAKNYLRLQLLNPYFNKYSMDVFDNESNPTEYQELLSQLDDDRLADYENIYFVDVGTSFYYVSTVNDFLIRLSLKKRVPNSIFPALLTDDKYFNPSDDFDYAVFQDDEILFQRSKFGQGEWPAAQDFENSNLYNEGIEKNNRHYYGVKTVDGRIILIISKKYDRRVQLANFSFFFLINLFFIGTIVLLSPLKISRLHLDFTGKIQLYLGLAFVIPLFTASFALLNSLNSSYREEINRNYLKRSLYLSELLNKAVVNSVDEIHSERLADIRNIMQADISLYDVEGRLVATSQREIFDLKLQGPFINPIVYKELIDKENQGMIADESIGKLDYKVSYATLNDHENQVMGFIAMPFFDSKNHLNRQQLQVFGNLITIFAFIFIVAILFGNIVLNNLLQPLRLVADKIRQMTLHEENMPIVYESSDEIGSLAKDYNSMLVKLEKSKEALARSQKEMAWKEIAKQVAHEIKNPLTPMHLKIQQLLRKHKKGTKDHEILTALFRQVDTLSQIAGSFSAFAKMPVPENTPFDLSKAVNQVVNLYHVDNVNIKTEIEKEIFIKADKDIFQRILNNIVLNAIQSTEGNQALLKIKLIKKESKCELSVQDNGRGIPETMKDKIFINYFSTKTKGSGIGLALAKKGIENAGGNIWFESKEGEGSTFFISLPLASK